MNKQILFKKWNRLFSVLFYLCLTIFLFSCEKDDFVDQTSPTASKCILNKSCANVQRQKWMSKLSDDAWLKDITLVGSEGSLGTLNTNALGKQIHGLQQQFEAGVRMFDLEVKTDDGLGENDFFLSYDDTPIQTIIAKSSYVSLLAPREYTYPKLFSNVIIELERFLDWNPSEFLIVYVHKSESTPPDKYRRILNKLIQNSYVLTNQFTASTRLGSIRGKILVMEIDDKENGKPYMVHNNERIYRELHNHVTTGNYQWKLERIYDGIYNAQKASVKDMICITYACGSSHYVSHQGLANYVLSPTADYIKNHIQRPYGTEHMSHPYFMQRSGFIFANFVTSDGGNKLIDTCIEQSIKTNDGVQGDITHGAYMWIYNR